MCCLCDACKWGWRPLGITSKRGINAGCINVTQFAVQWKYTLANGPRFCTPFCQYCLRLVFLLQIVSWKAETISTGNCAASSTIKVGVMFWKFSKHHEKVVRFEHIQQNERKQMKIRWFSEELRSLPTNAEGSRKRAEDVSIIYHIYLRVQSPESRVQSPVESSRVQGPVQSPVLILDCAGKNECSQRKSRNFKVGMSDSGNLLLALSNVSNTKGLSRTICYHTPGNET